MPLVLLAVLAAATVGMVSFALSDRTPQPSEVQSAAPTMPAPTKKAKVVAFLGDSFTAGSGATGPTRRWTKLVSAANGWTEANFGFSGTNYATSGNVVGGTPYTERVQSIVAAAPEIVFVSAAGNSMGTDQSAGVRETFQKLRAGLPKARIIATSPYFRAGEYPAVLKSFGTTIKAEVEAVGGEYMDLGNPLGARPDGMSDDGIHPNDAGYQLIADAVQARL